MNCKSTSPEGSTCALSDGHMSPHMAGLFGSERAVDVWANENMTLEQELEIETVASQFDEFEALLLKALEESFVNRDPSAAEQIIARIEEESKDFLAALVFQLGCDLVLARKMLRDA